MSRSSGMRVPVVAGFTTPRDAPLTRGPSRPSCWMMFRRWIHLALALALATTMSWSVAHARVTTQHGVGVSLSVATPCDSQDCECDNSVKTPCKALAACAYACSHAPPVLLADSPVLRAFAARDPAWFHDGLKASAAAPPKLEPPIA